MEEPRNYLVFGPSGAGKSFLLDQVRSSVNPALTFDLDFVGFRINARDWTDWRVNESIFPVLRANALSANRPMVAAGACSNWSEVATEARRCGFEIVCLCPPERVLRANREKRRDAQEKVNDSRRSFESWIQRARDHHWRVFQSVDECLRAIA